MTTSKKISVKLVSNVDSANSFGVFCRLAPSTSAIIWSRNDSPGLLVIRTSISSLTTNVPPMTDEKSPPASLMTGADSPVIADSSIEARPLMISPSPGTYSPVRTKTMSPFRSVAEETVSIICPTRLRAMTSAFEAFKESAWAFPRPSAIDSAKFANKTVKNRMMLTAKLKPRISSMKIV